MLHPEAEGGECITNNFFPSLWKAVFFYSLYHSLYQTCTLDLGKVTSHINRTQEGHPDASYKQWLNDIAIKSADKHMQVLAQIKAFTSLLLLWISFQSII